jgi:hypothetical protein
MKSTSTNRSQKNLGEKSFFSGGKTRLWGTRESLSPSAAQNPPRAIRVLPPRDVDRIVDQNNGHDQVQGVSRVGKRMDNAAAVRGPFMRARPCTAPSTFDLSIIMLTRFMKAHHTVLMTSVRPFK